MSKTREDFILSQGEKSTALWQRLKAYLENELAIQRGRNDGVNLNEAETAALRGDISRLKALLALDEDRPVTED